MPIALESEAPPPFMANDVRLQLEGLTFIKPAQHGSLTLYEIHNSRGETLGLAFTYESAVILVKMAGHYSVSAH